MEFEVFSHPLTVGSDRARLLHTLHDRSRRNKSMGGTNLSRSITNPHFQIRSIDISKPVTPLTKCGGKPLAELVSIFEITLVICVSGSFNFITNKLGLSD